MEPKVHILAVCGSLGARSSNLELLQHACRVAPSGISVTLLPPIDRLPHFNPDLLADQAVIPEVDVWRRAVAESDALLIATPEYGFSMPGALKNALDWLIGSGELEGKVVGVTASVAHPTRGRAGIEALCVPLRAVSATIVGALPLVRGETLDAELVTLLQAISDAVRNKVR